jgi:hypothetical protein
MESIYLAGSEDVRTAAGQMANAAHEMTQAANLIYESMRMAGELMDRLEMSRASMLEGDKTND